MYNHRSRGICASCRASSGIFHLYRCLPQLLQPLLRWTEKREFPEVPRAKGGYQDDTFDININFNMFEDVNGPMPITISIPFLESTWQLTEHDEIQANCLYLTDVHSKEILFVEAALEGDKQHMAKRQMAAFHSTYIESN